MTQLDLPQISFARYLDLLKRRRWQVIPVSVLGLLIGALVAFLIPRYYVVGTKLRFNNEAAAVSVKEGEQLEDRLLQAFEDARITIPAAVDDLLRKLQWPEALHQDPDRKQAFISGVRERIEVRDLSAPAPGGRARKSLLLGIGYRDTDGYRALELITQITDAWIEREKQKLLGGLTEKLRDRNDARARAAANLEGKQKDKQQHEVHYNINPEDWATKAPGDLSARTTRILELEKLLLELQPRIARQTQQLDKARDKQATTPPTITHKSDVRIDPLLKAELDRAQLILLQLAKRAGNVSKSHPLYAQFQRQLQDAQMAYELVRGMAEQQQNVTARNPDYEKLYEELDRLSSALAQSVAEEATWNTELKRLRFEFDQLPLVYREYSEKIAAVQAAEAEVRAHDEQIRAIEGQLRVLSADRPYDILERPYLPPRPTDPSITLVALIGSLLGLGAAIVLILLFDMLRTTFKTIDDVERGLPVPVLGGISYMETTEQRAAVGARRLRISLVAFAFVVLIVAIVVVYYVAPTRLPGPVQEVLDVLLGAPKK